MTERVFNFGAGPGTLPPPALEQAREDLLSLGDLGIGVLEVSHRSPEYTEIHEQAGERIRRLLGAEDDEWALLWLGGGASTQFYMAPMNLGADADYVVTGSWAEKALKEAKKLGDARAAASSESTSFDRIPAASELELRDDASFLHITSNNTIFGTQWASGSEPRGGAPLVCDASSDILSRPLDLSRYGMIYAGAQKNLGPAGVTLVLIRKELLGRSPKTLPTMIDYNTHAEKNSLFNTPPVFGIYVTGLVAQWIEEQGGLSAMAERNERKAGKLYEAIDGHDLYTGHADPASRSRMNVTFRLGDPELERTFVSEAKERGLHGLKGHRSVGGVRASIYNAMPEAGIDALVSFMKEFAARHG